MAVTSKSEEESFINKLHLVTIFNKDGQIFFKA